MLHENSKSKHLKDIFVHLFTKRLSEILHCMLEEQILKIKNGNLEELDKVYKEMKPKFFSYAKSTFRKMDIEDIEDAYQDTMMDFYNNIQRGSLTEISRSLSAYIIQIGKVKLIKLSDKKNLFVTLNNIEELTALQNYDHRIDDMVKFVFGNVSENCKKILDLFYFKRKSMDEIATELGYKNADTVKAKKNRCISKLSEQVTKMRLGYE